MLTKSAGVTSHISTCSNFTISCILVQDTKWNFEYLKLASLMLQLCPSFQQVVVLIYPTHSLPYCDGLVH